MSTNYFTVEAEPRMIGKISAGPARTLRFTQAMQIDELANWLIAQRAVHDGNGARLKTAQFVALLMQCDHFDYSMVGEEFR